MTALANPPAAVATPAAPAAPAAVATPAVAGKVATPVVAGKAATTAVVAPVAPIVPPKTVSAESIVIRGQWVQDPEGKDLIIMDPTDQAYEVIYADKETSSVSTFEKDSTA